MVEAVEMIRATTDEGGTFNGLKDLQHPKAVKHKTRDETLTPRQELAGQEEQSVCRTDTETIHLL